MTNLAKWQSGKLYLVLFPVQLVPFFSQLVPFFNYFFSLFQYVKDLSTIVFSAWL
jgi:hypothetical protein